MSANSFRLRTGASTNLNRIANAPAVLKGLACFNTAAYAIYLKLYWFQPTASAEAPTVGTTAPDMTIAIPCNSADFSAVGQTLQSWSDGIIMPGSLWCAVTKLAANSDTTAVASGDGLLNVFYE